MRGKAEPVRRFNVIDFDGYKLPGRIEEAKQMGFKDCKSGYGHFECARTDKITLLGVEDFERVVEVLSIRTIFWMTAPIKPSYLKIKECRKN